MRYMIIPNSKLQMFDKHFDSGYIHCIFRLVVSQSPTIYSQFFVVFKINGTIL